MFTKVCWKEVRVGRIVKVL
jgi:phospholipid-transporting ATPase